MAIKRADFVFVPRYMNTLADELISFCKFCGLGEVKQYQTRVRIMKLRSLVQNYVKHEVLKKQLEICRYP